MVHCATDSQFIMNSWFLNPFFFDSATAHNRGSEPTFPAATSSGGRRNSNSFRCGEGANSPICILAIENNARIATGTSLRICYQ